MIIDQAVDMDVEGIGQLNSILENFNNYHNKLANQITSTAQSLKQTDNYFVSLDLQVKFINLFITNEILVEILNQLIDFKSTVRAYVTSGIDLSIDYQRDLGKNTSALIQAFNETYSQQILQIPPASINNYKKISTMVNEYLEKNPLVKSKLEEFTNFIKEPKVVYSSRRMSALSHYFKKLQFLHNLNSACIPNINSSSTIMHINNRK